MVVYYNSIAKKFNNSAINVALFLWCWLVKIALQFDSILVNAKSISILQFDSILVNAKGTIPLNKYFIKYEFWQI